MCQYVVMNGVVNGCNIHTMTARHVHTSLCVQGLLGVFFKIEAVALFEDVEPSLKACAEGSECQGSLPNVKYYAQEDVTNKYSNAA